MSENNKTDPGIWFCIILLSIACLLTGIDNLHQYSQIQSLQKQVQNLRYTPYTQLEKEKVNEVMLRQLNERQ